jgi:hypothetical protein
MFMIIMIHITLYFIWMFKIWFLEFSCIMFLRLKIMRLLYLMLAQNVREKNMIVIEQIKWGTHMSFQFLKIDSRLL